MATVIGNLLESPLSERYPTTLIATYRTRAPVDRVRVFALAMAKLVAWGARPGPRVAHVHTAARGSLYRKAVVVLVAKALRVKVVLHVHTGAADIEAFVRRLGPLRRRLVLGAVRRADRVLTVSAAGAEAVRAELGRADVELVPNAAPPRREPAGGGTHRSAGAPTLFYAGGFANPSKGGAVLARALDGLVSACPDATVVLAGPGDPPPQVEALASGAGRVRWLGWIDGDEKANAFESADVFVFPSLSEGLPIALLEAMTLGAGIVATRVGGMPEVLTDRVDSLLIPAGDPDAIAAAVRELVDDPALRAKLGAAARERVKRLNEDEVWGRLDSIYRELSA